MMVHAPNKYYAENFNKMQVEIHTWYMELLPTELVSNCQQFQTQELKVV